MRSLTHVEFTSITVLILSLAAQPEVKIAIDHNTGIDESSSFKFKHVPSPAQDDAAAHAKLALVVGRKDGNSADLNALTDGVLPGGADEPEANFFFSAGSDGGRFRIDLLSVIEIAQMNTYSWHPETRGPQIYNLFASDGADPRFNPAPDASTDPATCGWKLIATVNTRPKQGEVGGQYGVSISNTNGSLGKYRYLLFDSIPTENDDPFGNTFFSEVDVIAKK